MEDKELSMNVAMAESNSNELRILADQVNDAIKIKNKEIGELDDLDSLLCQLIRTADVHTEKVNKVKRHMRVLDQKL